MLRGVLVILAVFGISMGAEARVISHQACIELAEKKPDAAFDAAIAWRDLNGGRPARHCAAVALFRLELYKEAGERFEQLARETRESKPAEAAFMLGEAALAWLLTGDNGKAWAAYSVALEIHPEDAGIWIDRAALLGELGQHEKALKDLDEAAARDDAIPDLWLFRAASYRATGQLDQALAAATKATELAPDLPDGWLEKGLAHVALGENEAGRKALLQTRLLDEEGPAGILAGEAISKLADEEREGN